VLWFALVARSRFELRPQMFNLAMMMALYYFVFVARPRLDLRQFVCITASVALWANLHSGVVLFPVLIAVYVAVEWLARRIGWSQPEPADLGQGSLVRVAWLGVSAALATVLTPNHVRLIPYVLESNRINRGLSLEWSSIVTYWGDPANLPFEMGAFVALLLALALAIWVGRRSHNAGSIAVVCVLALLPFSSARFVEFAFAPIVFVHAVCCASWVGSIPGRASTAIYAAVLLLTPLAFGPQIDRNQFHLWIRPVGNFQPVTFPAGAVRFLDETRLQGHLYNLERWGGYVLLQTGGAVPIFADGRWVTIGERVVRDGLMIEHREEQTFEKLDAYGVDVLLVPRGWMTDTIRNERGWLPVFENFNAGVYLRSTDSDDFARCRRYYRRLGIPFDPAHGFDGRVAHENNPQWARAFRVEPRHVVHFGLWGNPVGVAPERIVEGW